MVEGLKPCGSEGAKFVAHHWKVGNPSAEDSIGATCKNCTLTRRFPKDPLQDGFTFNTEYGRIAHAEPNSEARDITDLLSGADVLG